ncbi:MAG: hypothetical protein K6T57_02590 [Thermaceae bacterium]|nr:hypothetical protein [Thermaceae bacterium]
MKQQKAGGEKRRARAWLFPARALALGSLLLMWVWAQQAGPPPAQGQDTLDPFAPTATLERKGKTITAIKTSPDDQGVSQIEERDLIVGKLEQLDPLMVGGKAVRMNDTTQMAKGLKVGEGVTVEYVKDEDHPDQTPLARRVYAGERKGAVLQRFVFNDPAPFRVNVRFGKDAQAFGALALVEKIKDGGETVQLDGGSASYNEAEDRLEIQPKAAPKAVEVRQGKSTVYGSRLEYDNDTGEASILGPNEISRSGDKPLKGQSQRMVYNVDDETLRMFGEIKLEQNGRTTLASSALVREKDGVAYLFGSDKDPVVSTDKNGTAKGRRIRYNLDTGDVVVEQPAGSEFNDQ